MTAPFALWLTIRPEYVDDPRVRAKDVFFAPHLAADFDHVRQWRDVRAFLDVVRAPDDVFAVWRTIYADFLRCRRQQMRAVRAVIRAVYELQNCPVLVSDPQSPMDRTTAIAALGRLMQMTAMPVDLVCSANWLPEHLGHEISNLSAQFVQPNYDARREPADIVTTTAH